MTKNTESRENMGSRENMVQVLPVADGGVEPQPLQVTTAALASKKKGLKFF